MAQEKLTLKATWQRDCDKAVTHSTRPAVQVSFEVRGQDFSVLNVLTYNRWYGLLDHVKMTFL